MNVDERIQALLIKRFNGEAKSVLCYLSYRRNPNIKNNFGTTLLHMVATDSFDNLALAQYLCHLGANINSQDIDNLTPLHVAVLQKNYKISDFLITQGAAVNIQERRGRTALHFLIDDLWLWKKCEKWKRAIELVKKLLHSGADPNLPDIYGQTPLMLAVRQNDFALVKDLLMFGGNVHLRSNDSDTCLHISAWSFKPNEDILMELVKYGACINCYGSLGKSVIDFMLRYYPMKEGLKTVKLLIKTATLVNWKSKICLELETDHEFHYLEEFIDRCYTEVSQMKTCTYSDKSSLCHFALIGGNASQQGESTGKSIFDEVFETLMNVEFPIYEDLICAHFGRTFLFQKSLKMNVYARNEEKKAVFLNSDIMLEVLSHLKDKDLFHLVKAYSKPDVIRVKNDKIYQLSK